MVSTFNCGMEHGNLSFFVDFVDPVIDISNVIHFEALVGLVVLEEGFQLVKQKKLGAVADG